MGGLRRKIPWTFLTMMCAAVAIAGVPPFAGFFSKDAILLAAPPACAVDLLGRHGHQRHHCILCFPRMFLAFFGKYRGTRIRTNRRRDAGSLVVLALLSITGGFLFKIPAFLGTAFEGPKVEENSTLMAISTRRASSEFSSPG